MKKIIFICLFIVSQFVFSTPIDTHLLNVSVQGLNLLITPKKATNYPLAGIKILSSGYTVSGCTKKANGYCRFKINKGKTSQLTLSRPGRVRYIICLNAVNHLQCQNYVSTATGSSASKIYIGSTGSGGTGYVTYCPLINGNIDTDQCKLASTALTGTSPYYLSINKSAKKIYITESFGSTVRTCSLNSQGAIVAPCSDFAGFTTTSGVYYNPKFNKLYVANTIQNNVSVCTLNANGTIASCSQKTGFLTPSDITINDAGTRIYVSNKNDGSIAICNLNNAGSITTCPYSTAPNSFNNPDGVVINSLTNKIYIANNNSDAISTCSLAANGSINLASCSLSNPIFNFPRGLALNAAEKKLYVAESILNGVIAVCNLSPAGSIGTCTKLVDGFVFPTGLTLN
ncbi:YncE family protein [Legionella sp. km772]|uniref:YncE family protein n=1 Tax=Legionella sp. km772 TaxID=2498111 RepID=UPI000F8C3D38|nr:YncE family protein [Legionella sp. km772]RUR05775.1 hypothetical protein ELY15_13915 [Legionella sp. km772]